MSVGNGGSVQDPAGTECTEGNELQNKCLHFGFVHKVHQPGHKEQGGIWAIHAQHTMDARSKREKPSDISNQARSQDCIAIG